MKASNFGKRIVSSGSAVTVVSFQRRASFRCCCYNAPYLLRQLIWRLKSHWKRALGAQRSRVRYSYDIRSYSLNFDDGFF
ncbi:hypothetical protein PanWU01x14_267480 [Parasponia andersonii]|uniref:Uncharacterized protein n=1 Tax=Parasponia andersonii TaxID=3476 RepID=A0A2P5B6D8_PARAD|nr:hypothetical protein PanWU01x14_267480 [Parasponia andersonii]